MFDDIVQSLFERQEEIVTYFGGQGPGRQVEGDIEPATDAGGTKKVLSKLAKICDQAIERIVFGIYGPNNFIHRPSQLARRAVDLVHVGRCLSTVIELSANGL